MNLKRLFSRKHKQASANILNNKDYIDCDSCKLDAEKITQDELEFMMISLNKWIVIKEQGIQKVQCVYTFNNFVEALNYSNQIGELAEQHNHHPSILIEWGKVTVTWWSHGIGGLTLQDLDMAGGCDKLF